MIPFSRPALPDPDAVAEDVRRIVASGRLTKGPMLERYERALAHRLDVPHVVGTASCTTGLALLVRALRITGAVVMPSFTFTATAGAVVWGGARPLFADVDPDSWTLDPQAVRSALTPEVQAILGVHVFGVPCDVDGLQAVADEAGVPLLFDAAHGMGATYRGRPVGGFGTAASFSTSPTKTLTTGEGGFVSTADDTLAAELRSLVEYGVDSELVGLNGRLAEIPAAIGLRALDELDAALKARRTVADAYREALSGLPGLRLQSVPPDRTSANTFFTVAVEGAQELAGRLEAAEVEHKRYFSPAVHRQAPYRSFERGPLPVTERLEREVLSLPLWAGMSESDVARVVDVLRQR